MIVFHEGLPRSGKSYEALVRHMIPALRKGREVWAYIEGLDHIKIAMCAEISETRCRELLHPVKREDVPRIWQVVTDNSLVFLDEAQNFWPTGRQKLDADTTQFITEHGHRGLDILLMGQVLTDVHKLWRGRVSQRVVFNKLDAVGQEGRYNVTVYKATAPEKFEKISSAFGVYDSKYFGCYASHVSSETNTLNYQDDRANVIKQPWVKWGLPVAGVVAVWGLLTAWNYFHRSPVAPAVVQPAAASPAPSRPASVPVAKAAPSQPSESYVASLNERFRPRLAFFFKHGNRTLGAVEWWDGEKLFERLTFEQIGYLGTAVVVRGDLIEVQGRIVTPWRPPVRQQDPITLGKPLELPTFGSQS